MLLAYGHHLFPNGCGVPNNIRKDTKPSERSHFNLTKRVHKKSGCIAHWDLLYSQMHCSGMAWHPDVATQLVLCSEDDRLPVIQLWDLRFASSPLKVLESHSR